MGKMRRKEVHKKSRWALEKQKRIHDRPAYLLAQPCGKRLVPARVVRGNNNAQTFAGPKRRFFPAATYLAIAGALTLIFLFGGTAVCKASQIRRLSFRNLHTGEYLEVVYYRDGSYIPSALKAIAHVLRDFRQDVEHPIDPRLLDLLYRLHEELGSGAPYEVISGYRSPETNAMLRATTEGVSRTSLHMQGKAIDVRLADITIDALYRRAVECASGGVGYYPRSGFVHVDVGKVRHWWFPPELSLPPTIR